MTEMSGIWRRRRGKLYCVVLIKQKLYFICNVHALSNVQVGIHKVSKQIYCMSLSVTIRFRYGQIIYISTNINITYNNFKTLGCCNICCSAALTT